MMVLRKVLAMTMTAMVGTAFAGVSLPKDGWTNPAHSSLQSMLDRHDGDPDAYAIFDFDMTCAIGDCGHCTILSPVKTIE